MYLSCYRAIDYLASRDDWDGRTLIVMGASQGGQQTLMTAGLHPQKITAALALVPAGCDQLGPALGLAPGFPQWYWKTKGKDETKVRETSKYFDVANFTPRIKCAVLVGVGLIDDVCPPTGVFAAINQITTPKEVIVLPSSGHQDVNGSQGPYNDRLWKVWLPALKTRSTRASRKSLIFRLPPKPPEESAHLLCHRYVRVVLELTGVEERAEAHRAAFILDVPLPRHRHLQHPHVANRTRNVSFLVQLCAVRGIARVEHLHIRLRLGDVLVLAQIEPQARTTRAAIDDEFANDHRFHRAAAFGTCEWLRHVMIIRRGTRGNLLWNQRVLITRSPHPIRLEACRHRSDRAVVASHRRADRSRRRCVTALVRSPRAAHPAPADNVPAVRGAGVADAQLLE